VLLFVVPGFAQSSFTGRVVDPQGAAVGGADVTLVTQGASRNRSTRTAADGTFSFGGVTAGEHVLIVRAPGFAEWTQPVTVSAAAVPLDVALEVAGVTEDVTVQGALLGTAATGKTTLPLREIPMTVHGVPSNVIEEQGANDLVSAIQNVPGVNAFTQYGIYEGYTFRGFLDLFPSQAVQLVDGVRAEGNRINTQLAHIERVDVLKGPSSMLYGGSALGATVNLIRKKPSAQPAFDFSAAAGSWALARGAFGATGRAVGNDVLYRLDVGADSREGYRHNETRRLNVTPSLAWRLTPDDQVNVYYTFSRDAFAGDAGIPMLNTDFGSPLPESVFPDVPRDRNYRTPQDFARAYDNNLQVTYARQVNGSLGFRNTLSYRHFNDDYFVAEFLYVEPPSTVAREYLQFKHHRRPLMNIAEITARVTRGVEQNIVAGWEGQRYSNRTNTTPGGGVAGAAAIDLYEPVETQTDLDLPLARVAHFTNTTNGFYVQDHVTVAPQLKVLLGGRFDVYRRQSHNNPVSNGVETEGPVLRREAEALTGRAGVVYQPVPALDLYASYATSFTPLTQAQPDGTSLEPERGTGVDVGQRLHLFGGRVQINTAIYRIVRENVAFSRPGGFFDQASSMRSRGFEADVQTSPVSNWRVNGGYAFTDSTFRDFLVNPTTNLEGRRAPFVPRHTFSAWTAYDWPNGFGVNVGVRSLSSVFVERTNALELDGYGLLELGVRYRRGPVEYGLLVKNATDTKYFASALYDTQLYPGDPINVLGTVRVRLR
jgi:iron complex outermembrane receptor protein